MIRVAAVGEGMVELTHRDETTLRLGYAGDTFNTATYLARSTRGGGVTVDYVTAVGDDRNSDDMVERLAAERIGTGLVWRRPNRSLGLYQVRTDADGERSFTYYRSTSAATGLFGPDQPAAIDEALAAYDVVYLSLITVQIIAPQARQRLWQALDAVRARGGRVVFDSNYRPQGWADAEQARAAVRGTLRRTDIALPTWQDERDLFGDCEPQDCVRRVVDLGVTEGVVKNGAQPCLVFDRHGDVTQVPAVAVENVVDTTAAGDAFNAAYLAARLRGTPPVEAARAGHRLAARVIGHPGAIMPLSADGSDEQPPAEPGRPGAPSIPGR